MNKLIIHRTKRTDNEIIGSESRIEDDKGARIVSFFTIEPLECLPCGRYFFRRCLGSDQSPYQHLTIEGQKTTVGHADEYMNENIVVGKSVETLSDGIIRISNSSEILAEILSVIEDEGMIDIIEEY